MLGIIETLRRGSKIADSMRIRIESEFPSMLLDTIVHHQVETQSAVSKGEASFSSRTTKTIQNPAYESYGNIVIELLQRLNIPIKFKTKDISVIL